MMYRSNIKRKIVRVLILAISGLTLFSYGIAVGNYKIFPYALIKSIKTYVVSSELEDKTYLGEKELLRRAFVDKMIKNQIYPPTKTVTEINTKIKEMFVPARLFTNAYPNIEIIDHLFIANEILKVNYRLNNKTLSAYAYYKRHKDRTPEIMNAALIIPGSGINQSSEIYSRNKDNYHGDILSVTEKFCDTFVFVKPNEDFLAIHNGTHKLSYNFIINWLLNNGGSYSAHYLINSLAITQFLKSKYKKVIVLGLSQGGAAALINSLQSKPSGAIIASGFSVLTRQVSGSGFNQIVIPGIYRELGNDDIYDMISKSKTEFLFTYGKKEKGTYKIEAYENFTGDYFNKLDNVKCYIHSNGHTFPLKIVDEFISSKLSQ